MKTASKLTAMVEFALLSALIIVFTFTPLGYLRLGVLEVTFLTVPVAVGAILLGPLYGALLGGVFGLTSFFTCFGTSAFGASLLAINPFYTFLGCVLPRVLCGLLAGLVFKMFRNKRSFTFFVSSLVCPIVNTLLFMGALVLFFYNTDVIQGWAGTLGAGNPFTFVVMAVGLQGVVEAVVCCLLGGVVARAVYAFQNKSRT